MFVQRDVRDAAAELKKLLPRVTVAHVLLNCVCDRLLGETVFQLKGRDRQAVDEEAKVESELRLIAAVTQLARDAEAIGSITFFCLFVARRRRTVEDVEMMRPMLDAIAQHVDGAALADLALQPRKKLASRRAVLAEFEMLRDFRLRLMQKHRELSKIDAVFAVIVLGHSVDPPDAIS